MTDTNELRIECPDCNKDWGHSYCGTCKGYGFVMPRSRSFTDYEQQQNREIERLTQENAALRELMERQQLGLDEAYKLMPYLHQYVSDGTELDGMVQVWLDNYEAMKRGAK